jgi:L-asparaginase
MSQVLDIGRRVAALLERSDIDGAVIVQGTDTLDETAFAWDLLPLGAKPVVVTGAMRSASQDGYDGPDNLRNAIRVAADRRFSEQGVVLAMDGEVHGADQVVKTHTHAYGTFKSPSGGPLAYVSAGEIVLLRARRARARLPAMPMAAALPVPIVTAVLDGDEASARRLTEDAVGVVIEATGSGNTHPMLIELAGDLLQRQVPVVVTSRAFMGRVTPGYGFDGGSSRWWAAGVTFAGFLDARKSRLALALGRGAGLRNEDLPGLYEPFGGGSRAWSEAHGPTTSREDRGRASADDPPPASRGEHDVRGH